MSTDTGSGSGYQALTNAHAMRYATQHASAKQHAMRGESEHATQSESEHATQHVITHALTNAHAMR